MDSNNFQDLGFFSRLLNDDGRRGLYSSGGGGPPKFGQLEIFGLGSESQGLLPLGKKAKDPDKGLQNNPAALTKASKKIDKGKEMEIWRRYKAGDKTAFRTLLNGGEHGPGYRGMLYGSPIGRRYLNDAPLPRSSIKTELLQNYKRALDTYQPDKGAALGSWVWTNLQKTSRFVTTYGQVAKIPENRISMVRTFHVVRDELESALGREPSDKELVAKLGWEKKQLDLVRTEARKDILMQEGLDEAPETGDMADAMDLIHYVHPTLDPESKEVLEYTYGLFGRQEIGDNNALALKLGISPNRVRAVKRKIAREVQKNRR